LGGIDAARVPDLSGGPVEDANTGQFVPRVLDILLVDDRLDLEGGVYALGRYDEVTRRGFEEKRGV
jgi:hypothetical protein